MVDPVEIMNRFTEYNPCKGEEPLLLPIPGQWFRKICALADRIAAAENEVKRLREMTRWIPVSEKLPSDPQRVIYCDPYDVGFANFYKGYFWPDDANGCMDMVVTHWKPFEFPSRPEAMP